MLVDIIENIHRKYLYASSVQAEEGLAICTVNGSTHPKHLHILLTIKMCWSLGQPGSLDAIKFKLVQAHPPLDRILGGFHILSGCAVLSGDALLGNSC